MNNKKNIIISIISLALCIVVTFAWINELQNPEGRVLALRFNQASVANTDLEVKLSVNVDGDVFNDITKLQIEGEDEDLATFDDFPPGSGKKFKVDITNLSNTTLRLRVLLSDIVCESDEMKNCIIIGTNGFEGIDDDSAVPSVRNMTLADGMDDSGGFTLVETIEIPPNNANTPVTVYFYVMFSAAGSENLENMTFSIGTINFLSL